ncbi:hypothetical protein DUI87_33606 [Hirundo rustica rustica]|uniref:Coatomer subunit gamma-2 n=1 Tax=Hirundo rustica rustica TaxID=333673 RepID=A0A3M0IMK7_HIRRU|nr:hypothetical protein DUI87_33606 [Hirundo rustica rustica]
MIKKFDKKDEESGSGSNPFQHLEKSAVLQEARLFNETPINPRRCLHILTKILYLLNQQTLRRMCYLTIKEMANISEDVIIVTSSLTKDMTGKEDVYRGPAIRALCRITDGTMLQGIERYMKQAIVDKVPSVSSSALVSSLHMMKISYDVVKRWINEAQEAASSDNIMVQYHALGLLYHLRKNDRLAVSKMLNKFTKSGLKSQFAYCMLIRIASKLLKESEEGVAAFLQFSQTCPALRSRPDPQQSGHEASVCGHRLQPGPENLHLTDSNRSIATLAITTLLKTGSERQRGQAHEADLLLRLGKSQMSSRCMMDSDDEVRDRATFYLNVLQQRQLALNAAYIFNEIALVTSKPEKVAPSRQDIFQEQLAAIPEFKGLGPLFKSSEPVQLTEAETEYFVRCIKHVFPNHIVFQFDCTNTLNDQLLERVTVQMEPADAYDVICCIPAPSLAYNQPGMCYTLVSIPQDDPTAVASTFSCTMKFTVRDCDPSTGVPEEDGYEDEYVLEDLEVTVSDHIQKVLKPNFAAAWEEVGDDFEKEETFALSSIKTLDGVYRGGCDVLVRSRLALGDGVTMQVTVRSKDETSVDVILASVG